MDSPKKRRRRRNARVYVVLISVVLVGIVIAVALGSGGGIDATPPGPASPSDPQIGQVSQLATPSSVGIPEVDGVLTPSQETAFQRLSQESAVQPSTMVREGVVRSLMIDVQVPDSLALGPQAKAEYFLRENGDLFQIPDPANQLSFRRDASDPRGGASVGFGQEFQGIPVFGSDVVVRVTSDGHIESVSAGYVPNVAVATQPSISESQAEEIAIGELQGTGYVAASASLVIYDPVVFGMPSVGSRLAYQIVVVSEEDAEVLTVLVDAHTGGVLASIPEIATSRSREVWNANQRGIIASQLPRVSDLIFDETGLVQGASDDNDARSVWNHTGTIYDYFWSTFGRDSFDDQGSTLQNYVHVDQKNWCPGQAGWFGTKYIPVIPLVWTASWEVNAMFYCTGTTGLDVVAHELTHAVTDATADLVYLGEAGALNESYSDVFAAMIDGTDPWRIALDDGHTQVIRDIADPTSNGNPEHYSDLRSPGDQNCTSQPERRTHCVHVNSGIPNLAAFLLAEGGEKQGIRVQGIGEEKLEQIYYETLVFGLTTNSTFLQARNATIASCLAQMRNPVAGKPAPNFENCQQIVNAFAAVGIGNPVSAPQPSAQSVARSVTLDPGHGWSDSPSGAAANGMMEKDITLEIAQLAKPLLEEDGIQVSMTRTQDELGLPLRTAVSRANNFSSDIVVSIHVNGGGGTGTESCYQIDKSTTSQSMKLASLMTQEVSSQLNLTNRGDYPEHYATKCDRYETTKWSQLYIHDMNPPTALIETAFIDGPIDDDVAKLRDRKREFAKAITDAIVLYFADVTSQPSPPRSDTSTMLVMDVSGSMAESWQGGIKIESAKSAANQIVNMLQQESQVGGIGHRLGLARFSTRGRLELGLTTDYDQARTNIGGLTPIGNTNLGEGLIRANEALNQATANESRIIILLSDGLSNTGLSRNRILSDPVQEAVNAGTCIYTVGFGDPGSLDEDLLRQIAAASGCGEYNYANVGSDLERVYIRVRHVSTGNLLAELAGTVSQGQTVQAGTFDVPSGQGELAISLYWPGSALDLKLTDPRGREVDENYTGASIATYPNLVYALIDQPASGTWKASVYGREVPQGTTQFDAIVSARTGATVPIASSGAGIAVGIMVLIGGGVAVYSFAVRQPAIRRARRAALEKAGVGSLALSTGPLAGQMIPFTEKGLLIGRGTRSDLNLRERSVSRQHAHIRYADGSWFIQDLGSSGGTFINGQRIQASRLKAGDQIKIGDTTIVFQLHPK